MKRGENTVATEKTGIEMTEDTTNSIEVVEVADITEEGITTNVEQTGAEVEIKEKEVIGIGAIGHGTDASIAAVATAKETTPYPPSGVQLFRPSLQSIIPLRRRRRLKKKSVEVVDGIEDN